MMVVVWVGAGLVLAGVIFALGVAEGVRFEQEREVQRLLKLARRFRP